MYTLNLVLDIENAYITKLPYSESLANFKGKETKQREEKNFLFYSPAVKR